MCGIYGRLSLDGEFDHNLVKQNLLSLHKLTHRGPDEFGSWENANVFLGMRRLSIIDLAGGTQPIWNEDHTLCIVYNGELYNYLDLRPELIQRGHQFKTESDTEVVLHAFEEWGADCLKRFNGMFAFAIWHIHKQTLFIARDRIGEKPLYYYKDSKTFAFASEIKAIVADKKIPRELNPKGLANFLAYGHAVAPQTIYKNIFKLLPGHFMEVSEQGIAITQYWDVGDEPQVTTDRVLSEDAYAEAIRELLDDSVKRRMLADVPVGAFLSGGVDSSAIVALMQRHATGKVKTFSLGFRSGGGYNELSEAKQVAAFLGTEHYELEVGNEDVVNLLRTMVYHYDEPFGDSAGFPIYLLSKFARQHVKVVLAGDGGDELFGGYRRYAADQFAPFYNKLPGRLSAEIIPNLVNRLPRSRRIKRSINTWQIQDPAQRYGSWLTSFDKEMQSSLLNPELVEQLADYDIGWPYDKYYNQLNGKTAHDSLNRMMYTDFKTWMVDGYMEKTDKATMACHIEARLPFLDYRLAELAYQIPGKYKVKGTSLKRILKHAVRGLVPDDVLKRPKHGFSVPTDPWFRGELKEFVHDTLLDQRARNRNLFNTSVVEKMLKEHVSGTHIWSTHLWLLLNLEMWHRIFIDGESV